MATVAEFTIGADQFPLGSIFESRPEVTVELERVVPTRSAMVPYLWVRGAESDDVVAAFGAHPGAARIELIDEVGDDFLLRVEWEPEDAGILEAITETDVTLLAAVGDANHWQFELRAENTDAISEFQAACRRYGITTTLTNLHALAPMRGGGEYDLTETQREALLLAYERGYYESPRNITLEEMAEELGISGQSLGSRLRGGIHRLIGRTLVGPESS